MPSHETSRPAANPPCAIYRGAIEPNQAIHAVIISGVGFSKPTCNSMYCFMGCSRYDARFASAIRPAKIRV